MTDHLANYLKKVAPGIYNDYLISVGGELIPDQLVPLNRMCNVVGIDELWMVNNLLDPEKIKWYVGTKNKVRTIFINYDIVNEDNPLYDPDLIGDTIDIGNLVLTSDKIPDLHLYNGDRVLVRKQLFDILPLEKVVVKPKTKTKK